MLRRNPGLALAAALSLGLAAGPCVPRPLAAVTAAALLAVAFVALVIGRAARPLRAAAVLASFVIAGVLRAPPPSRPDSESDPAPLPVPVVLIGTVVEPPVFDVQGGAAGAAAQTLFTLRVEPSGRPVRVICSGAAERVRGGQRLRAAGSLLPPYRPRNPGDPETPGSRTLLVPHPACMDRLADTLSLASLLGALRERLLRVLESQYPEPVRRFVIAMTLGDRRLLAPEIRDALLFTGMFHLLAISGLHVSLLMFLAMRAPLPERLRTAGQLMILFAFTLLTGASPPVARSAVMFALQALTRAGGRPARPLNTLGWSALALLAADPGNLTDVGFQLSFVSVAALVTWGDRLARAASGFRLIPRCLLASIAVSLATAAATAPILLFRFQRLHPLGPLWNLLAFPLTVIPLVGGLCSIALGVIHPALGSPVAWLVGPACSALLAPLSWGAGVPGSTVTLPPPPGALVLAAYALLGAGLLPPCRRTRALTALIIAGALACCVATRTDAPEIWTFDVGAGDAALLRFPRTASFLVDAGGPGASLVRAILTAGAPVVPSVFVTHPHEDHVRGIETVARMLGVRSAWGPRGWCSDPAGATAASIARTLGPCGKDASRGLRLTFGQSRPGEDASGGDRGDSVRVDVLLPLPLDSVVSPSATNDASLVLRIAYRGKRILFLGDLEETGVALLLAIERDLRAQVLVAPHHGRLNRLWPELVARVSPEHVMISGRGDGGAAQLARWLELRGIRTFGTWTAGAIRTRWTPSGWLPELARRAR